MGYNVALCVFATGRYSEFLRPLVATVEKHFLTSHNVDLLAFSDQQVPAVCLGIPTPHLPWPLGTMLRYHFLPNAGLDAYDYVFMCDADAYFIGDVGDEVLGDLVASLSRGNARVSPDAITYCRNPESAAYVPFGSEGHYYIGGFQGGRSKQYLAACAAMVEMVNQDLSNNTIPSWHDESYWNAYLRNTPPTVALPMDFCLPVDVQTDGTKLRALYKDHAAYRR